MFHETSANAAPATTEVHATEARAIVAATFQSLFADHPDVRTVRWCQSADPPPPGLAPIHDVEFELADGARFDADSGTFDRPGYVLFDAIAYARVADLLLTDAALLLAAFGLGVIVTATRDGLTTKPRAT